MKPPPRSWEEERAFVAGDNVLAKDFVGGKEQRWKVGEVIERLGRFKYKIKLKNGIIITRHVDALRLMRTVRGDRDDIIEDDDVLLPVITPTATNVHVQTRQENQATERAAEQANERDTEESPKMETVVPPTSSFDANVPRRNPRRNCGRPLRYSD